jgi:bifunctional isochorismate lyase / aryl carrier protein
MIIKEKYLSIEEFDIEISSLLEELNLPGIKMSKWDASIDLSALIITDFQNYFLQPESHAFISSAPAIILNIKLLIELFRKYNRPVIFTKHTNTPENADTMGYWWKDIIKENSLMAELYESLTSPEDIIIGKHQYDAFYQTGLDEILQQNNVVYPVICGVMTNLCCETTVRTAFVKGFRPVLPIDATAAYNRQFHIATFRNLSFGFSPLMTTEEVINKLK